MWTDLIIAHVDAAAHRCRITLAAAALLLALLAGAQAFSQPAQAPKTLQETGLYADSAVLKIDPRHLAFSPQYPLWTDGATKRRWISLPPGSAIDASDPDVWVFPIGTRLWKEFSFGGQRVETRYIERTTEGWLYAAYAWSADGHDATLVSERGRRHAYSLGGGRSHTIPGVNDCKACHQGGGSEVLGFSALQLSPDRDPAAPHAEPQAELDLTALIARGLLVGLPPQHVAPRIAASSPTERAALGYLHGNCGHCHNPEGALQNLGLDLRHVTSAESEPARASTLGRPMTKLAPGQSSDAVLRIAPMYPEQSALLQRVASRIPALQMPPLGTALVDDQAVALLRRWVAEMNESTATEGRER